MFERFTADAQDVVVGAQLAAREEHATAIGAEHLLVAIARGTTGPGHDALAAVSVGPDALSGEGTGSQGLDAQALATLGIDLAAVSARADEVFGVGALDRAGKRAARSGHIPFTKEAKKTLEVSLREALRLGGKSIHSGHILRAIVRLDTTAAHRALSRAVQDAGSDIPALLSALDRAEGDGRLAS